MPASRSAIPLFMMFGDRTMGVRGKFVLLSGLPVCVAHGVSSRGSVIPSRITPVHEKDRTTLDGTSQRG
jgi:hypothetical protein